MFTRRAMTVAVREYVTNVRRKEFLLITLGLPVLLLLIGGLSAVSGITAAGAFRPRAIQHAGLLDRSGVLDFAAAQKGARNANVELEAVTDEAAAQTEVKAGRLNSLIVVSKDYLLSGQVAVYRKSGGLLNQRDTIPLGTILTRALLAPAGSDRLRIERAIEPVGGGAQQFFLNKAGTFAPQNIGREASRFLVPYAFSLLLTTAIFIAANYLLRGIADEKENRVIEVVLSSVTPEELLLGKLIGLAGVGLTQVGVWLLMAAVPVIFLFSSLVTLTPAALLGIVLFFALGFLLYATLMAGLGALGTSYRESQQIAGVISMAAIFPIMFSAVLIEFPNGTLARVLSFIPFTAPTTMVMRMSAADTPLLDVLISALVTSTAIWLLWRVSVKLFRYGLLIYGKRPTFRETLRYLRQA